MGSVSVMAWIWEGGRAGVKGWCGECAGLHLGADDGHHRERKDARDVDIYFTKPFLRCISLVFTITLVRPVKQILLYVIAQCNPSLKPAMAPGGLRWCGTLLPRLLSSHAPAS